MLSHGVVEHFDVIEHIPPFLRAGFVDAPPDPLALQQVKEAFNNGIIMAVALNYLGLLIECLRLYAFKNDTHSRDVNCDP